MIPIAPRVATSRICSNFVTPYICRTMVAVPQHTVRAPVFALPEWAVEIAGLTKVYAATAKPALDGVTLSIRRGELFGLLGPNGAGKSTLINILAGLVNKTAGRVKIWDLDVDNDPRGSRGAIGIVPQELHIDPFFTPPEALEVQPALYRLPPPTRPTH